MNKPRLKLFAGLLALSLADPLIAACYEWVDEEGVVHFADQRPPGDRPVVEHREPQATEPNGKRKLSPEDASALDEAQAAHSCRNIQSTWAGMIGKGAAPGIVIVQDGFHIGITPRFDHAGKSGSVTAQRVVVESAIAFYDVVSSDFGFVGEVENRQIMVRPDVEAVLKAWPRWATAPSAADLADCVVVLVGNS